MEAATLLEIERVAALEVLQSALGIGAIAFDDRGGKCLEVEEVADDGFGDEVLALDLGGGVVEARGGGAQSSLKSRYQGQFSSEAG